MAYLRTRPVPMGMPSVAILAYLTRVGRGGAGSGDLETHCSHGLKLSSLGLWWENF